VEHARSGLAAFFTAQGEAVAAPSPTSSSGSPASPGSSGSEVPGRPASGAAVSAGDARKSTLREQALADAGVQALLEVFPAEIRDVEEM